MGTRPDRHSQAIEDLRSYGRSLVEAVPAGKADVLVGRVLAARGRRHLPRRLLVAMATLGLLAISNVGLAAVSDPAAPGDFLYPFDRGYEWASDLFVVKNRTAERLAESRVLDQRGDTDDAIELLREQLAVAASDQDLLVAAIEELESRASQGDGNQTVADPTTTAPTAPGQVEDEGSGEEPASPSDTAAGQNQDDDTVGSPSDDAPGQNKDKDPKDNPSVTAPGQNKDATTTTSGAGNGNGNGNGTAGS